MACSNPMTLLILIGIFSLFVSPSLSSTNAIYSSLGGKLNTEESLVYNSYTLKMQWDCNLVIYKGSDPIWASGTWHRASSCFLTLKSDGEAVIEGYNSIRELIQVWSSGKTSTPGDYALVLKYDGTLNVYGPVMWTNPSSVSTVVSNSLLTTVPTIDSTLWAGDVAPIGITVANGVYRLELLENCNMTLSNTETQAILWHTNSKDSLRDCFATLSSAGELMINYLGGAPLWRSGKAGDWGKDYVAALQPNGKLVVYNSPIWVSGTPGVMGYGEKIAMVTDH